MAMYHRSSIKGEVYEDACKQTTLRCVACGRPICIGFHPEHHSADDDGYRYDHIFVFAKATPTRIAIKRVRKFLDKHPDKWDFIDLANALPATTPPIKEEKKMTEVEVVCEANMCEERATVIMDPAVAPNDWKPPTGWSMVQVIGKATLELTITPFCPVHYDTAVRRKQHMDEASAQMAGSVFDRLDRWSNGNAALILMLSGAFWGFTFLFLGAEFHHWPVIENVFSIMGLVTMLGLIFLGLIVGERLRHMYFAVHLTGGPVTATDNP